MIMMRGMDILKKYLLLWMYQQRIIHRRLFAVCQVLAKVILQINILLVYACMEEVIRWFTLLILNRMIVFITFGNVLDITLMIKLEALDEVYEIMHKRQCGEDASRNFVTLVWDEYMANILALLGSEKKKAEAVMHKVSEILMLGRSLAVRLVIACQRPDATAFPTGSRLNFGVIIIVGATLESIYSMLMPKELIDKVGNREFHTGEGVMLWQGSELRFIKVPVIKDEEKMKAICVEALTR